MPQKKAEHARSSTPTKGRGKKKPEEVEETTEEEVEVTGTTTGSTSEDRVEEISKPETPKKVTETSTATVKTEAVSKNLKNLWENLNTMQCVGVVYVLVVAFLYHKWNRDMMCAFGISALMACITLYSLYKDEYLKQTALLLLVLGGVGGFVKPDKALNSIEAMQKQASSLSGQYAKCRTHKAAGELCFILKFKDQQDKLVPRYEELYGKPFQPRKDEDWDQYNQFIGCEIKRKAPVDSV